MNKKCTDKYIDEIKAREKAATPGPWIRKLEENATIGRYVWHFYNLQGKFAMDEADSDFICHSRTDIPMLIKQHEQNKKQINILTKALELACNDKMDCPAIYNKPPFKQCKNCKSGENFEECWYRYFIQQAQKQEKKK